MQIACVGISNAHSPDNSYSYGKLLKPIPRTPTHLGFSIVQTARVFRAPQIPKHAAFYIIYSWAGHSHMHLRWFSLYCALFILPSKHIIEADKVRVARLAKLLIIGPIPLDIRRALTSLRKEPTGKAQSIGMGEYWENTTYNTSFGQYFYQ